jgi:hypothetical protein
MPRSPCLFVPRATYHFYCRVARGEYVFDSDEEAIYSVNVLPRVRDLDGLTILACDGCHALHCSIDPGDIPLLIRSW